MVDFTIEFEPSEAIKHLPSFLAPSRVAYKELYKCCLNLCAVSVDLEDTCQTHLWTQTPGSVLRMAGLYFL